MFWAQRNLADKTTNRGTELSAPVKCQICGQDNPPEARFWSRYKWLVAVLAVVTMIAGIIGRQVEQAPSPGLETLYQEPAST